MVSECQTEYLSGWEKFNAPYPIPQERVLGAKPSVLGVIPCRWKSSRFPGKPLVDIGGKPMLWHVYQRVLEADCCHHITVATDDEQIYEACRDLGLHCLHTGDHATGTDRVAEVSRRLPHDIILNIQGDEPFITPHSIRLVTHAVIQGASVSCGCAVTEDPSDLIDSTVPKVVMAPDGRAIYLSRSPIPYPKKRCIPYYVQVCVYAFTPESLRWFAAQPMTPQEEVEGIELNRFMFHGREVQMVVVDKSPVSVDTPADLALARAYWEAHHA